MNIIVKKFYVIVFLTAVLGCATNELSSLQRRSIEARELNGKFDDAFKATLQVLQDYGYVIKNSDYDSGVIQGETGQRKSKSYWWDGMMINTEITATLEEFGENQVKERLSIIEKRTGLYGYERPSQIVDDPELFQKMYDDVQKEMFIRENLKK